MSLNQYFWTNRDRPINKWLHYLPIYEKMFAPFRNKAILFIEIGTGQGGSSQMWKHYFGPAAKIVTIDTREECREFADEQVAVRIGSQSDRDFMNNILAEFGAPDIVLDDGSHQTADVNATFDLLFPRLAREALYVVEDTHTAYWPAWGGGLRKPGTFIERMKTLVDELHAGNPHHLAQRGEDLPSSATARLVRSVTFHDSMVVIEKGPFLVKDSRSIPLRTDQIVW